MRYESVHVITVANPLLKPWEYHCDSTRPQQVP